MNRWSLLLAELQAALNDPEILAALQNPKMMGIFQDIMQNPGNVSKYMNDPDFMNVYSKLMSKFGNQGASM